MRDRLTINKRIRIGLKWKKYQLWEIETLMLYTKPDCEFDAGFFRHLSKITPVNVTI